MNKLLTRLAWLAGLLALTGCDAGAAQNAAPSSSPSPSPSSTPAPTAAVVASTQMPSSAPGQATVTAMTGAPAGAICPATHPAIPPRPAAFAQSVDALRRYLQAGADIDDAARAMTEWGYRFTPQNLKKPLGEVQPIHVLSTSVQGGPVSAMTYYDPASDSPADAAGGAPGSWLGNVLVVGCVNGRYGVLYSASEDPSFPQSVPNPRLFGNEDVTGDGVGDFSFLSGDCDDNGCADSITVVSSHGSPDGALRDITPDIYPVPYPSFNFSDINTAAPNQPRTLFVVEGISSNALAGPQRVMTDEWFFDGNVYTRTQSTLEPPVYRIHALQDGDEAYRRRNYADAEVLYRRVISDETLQPWEGGEKRLDNEPAVLAAVARLRLLQLGLSLKNTALTDEAQQMIAAAGATDPSARGYAQLGEILMREAKADKDQDPNAGCRAVVEQLKRTPELYTQLGPDTYGSANYEYAPEDLCIPAPPADR